MFARTRGICQFCHAIRGNSEIDVKRSMQLRSDWPIISCKLAKKKGLEITERLLNVSFGRNINLERRHHHLRNFIVTQSDGICADRV